MLHVITEVGKGGRNGESGAYIVIDKVKIIIQTLMNDVEEKIVQNVVDINMIFIYNEYLYFTCGCCLDFELIGIYL